ncbi:hypothetical protein EIP86_010176 [Pleurotus ostreatoroseus]|nr:hypothetical protein EIP86_010176 [Pleurotus ostreatoroseus]
MTAAVLICFSQSRASDIPAAKQLPLCAYDANAAQVSRDAIAVFMKCTGISIRGIQCDPEGIVDRRVREIASTWDIDESYAKKFYATLVAGVAIAISAYGHTPIATQVHIATYTLLTICVDDLIMGTDAVEEFMTRLYSGQPQTHPILQYLAENLAAMPDFFPPDAAKAIVASTVIFVNQTLFDKKLEGITIHQDARQFVESKRIKNGLAEAYSFFIWDKETFPDVVSYIQSVPETLIYLNFVNDIFSFYKEELQGDVNNYIHDRATVTNKVPQDALIDVVNEAVDAVERARAIVQTDLEKSTLERFFVGYVIFHFIAQRYHLYELTGSDYV